VTLPQLVQDATATPGGAMAVVAGAAQAVSAPIRPRMITESVLGMTLRRPGTSAGSAPSYRARTAAPTEGTPQCGGQPQENGGSDPALVPGDQGGSDAQNRAATPPTTGPAASSEDRDNVNGPLQLPLPITVPPLVPGKPGGLLG